jgi:hypothetical protein
MHPAFTPRKKRTRDEIALHFSKRNRHMMDVWPWASSFRNGHAAELSRRWLGRAREAGEALPRVAADYARDANDELRAFGSRAGRSTRKFVDGHTIETVLVVGLAAFAFGWLARRMQESRADAATRTRVRKPARPRAARANGPARQGRAS